MSDHRVTIVMCGEPMVPGSKGGLRCTRAVQGEKGHPGLPHGTVALPFGEGGGEIAMLWETLEETVQKEENEP